MYWRGRLCWLHECEIPPLRQSVPRPEISCEERAFGCQGSDLIPRQGFKLSYKIQMYQV